MDKRIIFGFVFLLMISSVYALGVSPARTTVDFKPNLKQTISYDAVVSGSSETNLVISAQGELASYINLPQNSVRFSSGEKQKTLSYDISLPDKLEPGLHTAEIFILELPSSENEVADTGVMATLAVVTQLYVYVPYPGKYANAQMEILNSKDGGVSFVFPVVSLGEFDLTSVKAVVDIFDGSGSKVDSFTTSPIEILSGQKKEIVRNWGANSPAGEYNAIASIVYDEGTINLNKSFSIGGSELVLQDISVNKFALGEIVKLDVLVENRWNENVAGAYVDGKILNDKGDAVSRFESAARDVNANSKENFATYWDTAGVRVGTYEADISIKYGDKSSNNRLKFQVEENKLTVIGLGYVISDDTSGGGSLVTFLVIIIIFLVLVNILWFFILRKKLKK